MSDTTPTPDAGGSGAETTTLEWHRVHRVTPLVRGWAVLAVLAAILGQQAFDIFGPGADDDVRDVVDVGQIWWVVALGLIALAAIVFVLMWLAWRKMAFAIGEREVHLRQGVIFRQARHARLDRLQAIDIRQPVVARLAGLAELRLEVAGGADSTVVIGFLREEEARLLRADILARAAGIRAGRKPAVTADAAAGGAPSDPAASDPAACGPSATSPTVSSPTVHGPAADAAADPFAPALTTPGTAGAAFVPLVEEAPEQELYVVPPGRLALSLVRSPSLWLGLLVIAGVAVPAIVLRQPSIAISALPALFGVGSVFFNRFAGEFNFRAAMSPDGIRVRSGLLETRAQTIPPGRVQAISLVQGPLWRKHDWWRVKVNVAGYQQTDTQQAQSILLPVGTRAEALTALWLVLPDLGTDEPLVLLDEALTGIVPKDGSPAAGPDGRAAQFTNAPRRAWIVDPLAWRRDAYAVTSRALLLRRGRLVRRLDVVPHERMQSVAVEQGPLQRRLRVATFAVHSTPGQIIPQVPHLDEADARRLLWEQAARARAARQTAGPERWMEAVAQGEPADVPPTASLASADAPAAEPAAGDAASAASAPAVEPAPGEAAPEAPATPDGHVA